MRHLLPLIVFAALIAGFSGALSLRMMQERQPALGQVDMPLPEFALTPLTLPDSLPQTESFTSEDLATGDGNLRMLHVFASWCPPCNIEHPVLMRMAEESDIEIWGINFQDRPEDAAAYLERRGMPYSRLGADPDGRIAIALGASGTPESYLIGPDGRIHYRFAGALNWAVIENEIIPLAASLKAEAMAGN